MSQRTGEILIIVAVLLIWVLFASGGSPGGRGVDYQESQLTDER